MAGLDIEQHFGVKVMSDKEVAAKITMADILPEQKKALVIYHANCADGFSAAWVFHYFEERKMANDEMRSEIQEVGFDFHPGVYSDEPPDCTGRNVYLVDFSYKKDVVKQICQVANEVWLIDHHKTAIEDLRPLADIDNDDYVNDHCQNFFWYVDLNRSGAMLAWDFLFNIDDDLGIEYKPGTEGYHAPPILLDHVQDRDLWKFKLEGTREINAAMFSYEYTFENWDRLMCAEGDHPRLTTPMQTKMDLWKEGAAIERKHFKDIKELLKITQREMVIANYNVPVANIPYQFSSDAGHIMAEGYAGGKVFAACYWDTPTHRIFSLRSAEGGADVSEIAKSFGGGGHEHAAGFRVPRDHMLAKA